MNHLFVVFFIPCSIFVYFCTKESLRQVYASKTIGLRPYFLHFSSKRTILADSFGRDKSAERKFSFELTHFTLFFVRDSPRSIYATCKIKARSIMEIHQRCRYFKRRPKLTFIYHKRLITPGKRRYAYRYLLSCICEHCLSPGALTSHKSSARHRHRRIYHSSYASLSHGESTT